MQKRVGMSASGTNFVFVNWNGKSASLSSDSHVLTEIRNETSLDGLTLGTFRKALATTMALDDELHLIESRVLGHSKQVMEEHYFVEDPVKVCNNHQPMNR